MSIPYYGITVTQGKCFKGEKCSYAHSNEELKEIPNLIKTKLCTHFMAGCCPKEDKCKYAHGQFELRKLNNNTESQVCNYFQQGSCRFGNTCKFLHVTYEQAKYSGMKNKSSTLGRTPAWGVESAPRATPQLVKMDMFGFKNQISEYPMSVCTSDGQNDDQAFFEDKGSEDFKFTLSYFK